MNTNVMCDKCKHNNVVGKGNLKQTKVSIAGDKNICKDLNVMYFVCSGCRSIVVVQVDDTETLRIRDSLSKVIMSAIASKKEGTKVGKKANAKRIRLTESLEKKRKKLSEKYKKEVEKVLTER